MDGGMLESWEQHDGDDFAAVLAPDSGRGSS